MSQLWFPWVRYRMRFGVENTANAYSSKGNWTHHQKTFVFGQYPPERALTSVAVLTPQEPAGAGLQLVLELSKDQSGGVARGGPPLHQMEMKCAGARGELNPGHLCPGPCVLSEPVATQPSLSL